MTLYVTEYSGLAPGAFGPLPVPIEPPLANYSFSVSGVSATSGQTFNSKTTIIRVHTDAICSIAIGASPTAVTTTNRMAANQTEYKSIQQGAGHTIAAIVNV
jgi:hypothetical protein